MSISYVKKIDSKGRNRIYAVGVCEICNKPHDVLKFAYDKSNIIRHKKCFINSSNLGQRLKGIARRTETSVSTAIWKSYVSSAHRRGHLWDINLTQFQLISKQNCVYCGIGPQQRHAIERRIGTTVYPYNGLDRKDNSIGYTLENCVPCCSTCNFAKRDMPLSAWKEYITRLVNFNKDKK